MSDEKSIQHYRQLTVWQKSMELAGAVYDVACGFPKDETYGLAGQIKRAAVSVPSNIAEGAARQGTGEFLHFISIARGSIAELETQLILSQGRAFLSPEKLDELLQQTEVINRMLSGLQRSLRSKKVA